MAINTEIATSSLPASTTCKSYKKWGAPCPFCALPAPLPSAQEFDWSDKDYNGNRHGEREDRKKKEQQNEEDKKKNKEEQVPVDCFPPGPIYDLTNKEDALPHCDPKMKQALDPNYYPPNYVARQEEDAPTLVDNIIALPVKTTREEDQGEDKKEKNNGGETNREEDTGRLRTGSGQR